MPLDKPITKRGTARQKKLSEAAPLPWNYSGTWRSTRKTASAAFSGTSERSIAKKERGRLMSYSTFYAAAKIPRFWPALLPS